MVNKATLIGHVGNFDELKKTQNSSFLKFSLATSERWKDKSGEQKEKTEWHSIVVFGRLAEVISQYITTGKLVYVEGKIVTNSIEKDGQKRFYTSINASEIKLLSKNSGDNNQDQDKQQSTTKNTKSKDHTHTQPMCDPNDFSEFTQDEIPF